MQFPDVMQVQVGSTSGGDGGGCLTEVHALASGVDNHHDSVIASGLWKFDDEVNAYGLPTVIRYGKGLEFSDG